MNSLAGSRTVRGTRRTIRLVGLSAALVSLGGWFTPAEAQSTAELIGELSAGDATARAMAACQLDDRGAEAVAEAMEALIDLLGDDTAVQSRLCRDDRGWRQGWYRDTSPGREAAIALEEAGARALDPLLDVLTGGSPPAREHAALALGMIEDARAITGLARRLEVDPVGDVRARAAWALGMIEDVRGVAPLGLALRDDDPDVREQAAWGLGMIESSSAVAGLSGAADDPDDDVREQVAWALGMIESADGVDPLVRMTGDRSANVRSQVAWALGMIEHASGVPGLLPLVSSDVDPDVRKQAAWALGMIEHADAVETLVEVLSADTDPKVREQAAWALGMIEDGRAVTALTDALEDPDEDVRDQAMWALGMVIGHAQVDIDRSDLARRLRRALDLD